MSTNIGEVHDMDLPDMGAGQASHMSVTRFAAGGGLFEYQFTIGGVFVQLSEAETTRLIAILHQRASLGDCDVEEPTDA